MIWLWQMAGAARWRIVLLTCVLCGLHACAVDPLHARLAAATAAAAQDRALTCADRGYSSLTGGATAR